MKKIVALAVALICLASFVSIGWSGSAILEVSIENLAKHPEAFNERQVTVQGFLVVEQLFMKPTQFYLRDNLNSMISVKFAKVEGLSNYGGKRIEVAGLFKASGNEMRLIVSTHNLLEEAEPEEQAVTGAQNTIVCMGYFTDRGYSVSVGGVYRLIFDDMNAFYMEASYDQMWVAGGWNSWKRLDHNVKYYGQDNPSWYFIRDLVAKADPYVNFAPYTKFLFVNAGPNQESSGVAADIWSARWSGLSIAVDGITITHGAIVPDVEMPAHGVHGVQAHEYAHELGLPDLYTYPSNVDGWDLMDSGTWNDQGRTPASFISWCRMKMGWIPSWKIRYLPYGAAATVELDPLEDPTGDTHVIRYTEIDYDYWLIEARRRVGFDAALPGDKVLILWHDYSANKVYLQAALGPGQSYRTSYVEVKVVADLGWAFEVYVSFKGWGTDKRLTVQSASQYTNWRGGAVASVGPYVYCVWYDYRHGGSNAEIYFKRSTNNGVTWSSDIRLTTASGHSKYPSIAAHGSYVYVVWCDKRDGNWEIYMRRSENYGASWPGGSYYQRLTFNSASSYYPRVAVYDRKVHVVWHDYRDGNSEIYYKRSTDNAFHWGADTRLTFNTAISRYASVAAYRNFVYVAWHDRRPGQYDIYFKRSTTNGVSWGSDTRLTTNGATQAYVDIAAYGKDVHVAWTDYRYSGNLEIYYRRSTNHGASWWTEQRLTASSWNSYYPSLAVKGKTVYVVWQDYKTRSWEIFFKDSADRGATWTADRILSAQPATSYRPSVSAAGDNVYVVWSDYRHGNYEIYFKYRW